MFQTMFKPEKSEVLLKVTGHYNLKERVRVREEVGEGD